MDTSYKDIPVENLERSRDEKSFADIVTDDVRGTATATESTMLRSPEHLDDFYGQLIEMLRSFELQLQRQKIKTVESRQMAIASGNMAAWEAEHIKVLEWRRTMNSFRRHVEHRIREIRTLRRATVVTERVPELLDAANSLYGAVMAHKKIGISESASEDDLYEADRTLWSVLKSPNVQSLGKRLAQMPK